MSSFEKPYDPTLDVTKKDESTTDRMTARQKYLSKFREQDRELSIKIEAKERVSKTLTNPFNIEYIMHGYELGTESSDATAENTADAYGAQIVDIGDREKYAEKNREFCERLNAGEHFAASFDQQDGFAPGHEVVAVSGEGYGLGDEFYGFVRLDGDTQMPFPFFEEAIGKFLRDQPFVKKMSELYSKLGTGERDELLDNENAMGCRMEDIDAWLKSLYGEQFDGVSGDRHTYPITTQE